MHQRHFPASSQVQLPEPLRAQLAVASQTLSPLSTMEDLPGMATTLAKFFVLPLAKYGYKFKYFVANTNGLFRLAEILVEAGLERGSLGSSLV